MKTYSPRPGDIAEKWYLVDAEGQTLGRFAARAAALLRGKHLACFSPHWDMKTHVVVINADKVVLTGRKMRQKLYIHHSGWPHGLKVTSAEKLKKDKPGEILRRAIYGMLPKTRLGRVMRKRLRVFAGPTHRHAAQNPEPITINARSTHEE
ncbi:50S ribosomal protein L13 [Candidatus Sumerlaeota bacterium]|nr:50S ribosomal protein L13 [Candidatus Sumerlaeota bacterium]